jgi:hypothetical protein
MKNFSSDYEEEKCFAANVLQAIRKHRSACCNFPQSGYTTGTGDRSTPIHAMTMTGKQRGILRIWRSVMFPQPHFLNYY